MSKMSFIAGIVLLVVSLIVLTICSSTALHEYIWETFNEGISIGIDTIRDASLSQ